MVIFQKTPLSGKNWKKEGLKGGLKEGNRNFCHITTCKTLKCYISKKIKKYDEDFSSSGRWNRSRGC
jgi:hypothetical protein